MFKTEINYNLNSMTGGDLNSNSVIIAVAKARSSTPSSKLMTEEQADKLKKAVKYLRSRIKEFSKLTDAQRSNAKKVIFDLLKLYSDNENGIASKKEALRVLMALLSLYSLLN